MTALQKNSPRSKLERLIADVKAWDNNVLINYWADIQHDKTFDQQLQNAVSHDCQKSWKKLYERLERLVKGALPSDIAEQMVCSSREG